MVFMSSTSMTIEQCRSCCSNYTYAGLQNGNECWCGDSFGLYGLASTSICNGTSNADCNCLSTCSGNSLELCGGYFTNSVYLSIKTCNSTQSKIRITNNEIKKNKSFYRF